MAKCQRVYWILLQHSVVLPKLYICLYILCRCRITEWFNVFLLVSDTSTPYQCSACLISHDFLWRLSVTNEQQVKCASGLACRDLSCPVTLKVSCDLQSEGFLRAFATIQSAFPDTHSRSALIPFAVFDNNSYMHANCLLSSSYQKAFPHFIRYFTNKQKPILHLEWNGKL